LELTGIIERLEIVRKVISDAFVSGKINFDAMTSELEAVINDLQETSLTSASEVSSPHRLKAKDVIISRKAITASDFK
jgi:hypothetical protein